MPTILLPRQSGAVMPTMAAPVNSPSASASPTTSASADEQSSGHHMGTGDMIGAIIIPIVLILALMTIFIVARRRRRRHRRTRPNPSNLGTQSQEGNANERPESASISQRVDRWFYALHRAFNHPQSSPRAVSNRNSLGQTASAAAAATNTNNNNPTNGTRQGRRGRRDRVRRTDSGATVKTLPEYDELREDEILLYKALDTPLQSGDSIAMMEEPEAIDHRESNIGSRHSSRNGRRSSRRAGEDMREQSTSPGRIEDGSIRRQSSLGGIAAEGLSALRRLSLRRNDSSHGGEESNEMDTMLQTEMARGPVSVIPEEPVAYEHLYPAIPPQIQVHTEIEESEDRSEQRRGGGGGLRNIFRRQPIPSNNHRRVLSTNDSSNSTLADLRLTPTRSNDQSLYRPSTSSSRRVFGGFLNNGSSASLLSQGGVDNSTDSPSINSINSVRHTRNISAPISTRRLQFAPPLAGFSDKQMQFLTSVESLDKYGIPVRDGGSGEDSSNLVDGQRLPAFEELARAREAEDAALLQLPRLAPLLTTGEIQARQEQSPLSASSLPDQPNTEATPIAASTLPTNIVNNNDSNPSGHS